jgi:hypothetical protein
MVEVNSSQIFMVLFMSLLIRRDCISVFCVYAVKKNPYIVPELHNSKFFFIPECGDFREVILFERKAFSEGLVTCV